MFVGNPFAQYWCIDFGSYKRSRVWGRGCDEAEMSEESGKSKWGLSNGGLRPLSAICEQSSTIVRTFVAIFQKCSGDPNPQYFSKSTAVQMGGVLPYKWEAYCSTNGRRIAGLKTLTSLKIRRFGRFS